MEIQRLAVVGAVMALMTAAHAVQTPYRLTALHSGSPGIDVTVDSVGTEYFISRDELKAIPRLRINLIPDIPGRPGIVKLSDIGLVKLDELNGELLLSVRPELLEPQMFGASNRSNRLRLPNESPMTAIMGDYDLRFDSSSGEVRFGLLGSASAWALGNRIDASIAAASGIKPQFTQLRVVREDLENSSLIEGGTISAASGSRASPGQIIGVGIRKDRGVTPGYITGPQLRVDGVARNQSTVDVLIDNQRVQHTTQPGPFSIIAEPTGNGGLASVVVRDDLGQERVVTAQLWANPSLLGIGQTEYALSVGSVSAGGLRSQGVAVASGYYRRGVFNWLTAEAGFEITAEYQRLTTAADVSTKAGDFALDLASGGGRSVAVRYILPSANWAEWAITGGAQASSTSIDFQYAGGSLVAPSSRYQKGINASATKDRWSISTTLAATSGGKFLSTSVSHRLTDAGASLSLTGMRFDDATGSKSNSVFLSLSIPIGGRFASLSAVNTSEGVRKQASFGGQVTNDISVSANMDGIHGVDRIGADASILVGPASVNLGFSKPTGKDAAYRGSLRSGFIAYPGGVAAAAAGGGDGGFVIVDLGAPGVEVLDGLGGRRATGDDGVAVMRVPSLENTKIAIDPNTSPDGLDLDAFNVVVGRRGGLIVKRHPVQSNGRFVEIEGAVPGDVLSVENQRLPITDRGVWVDLAKGIHNGQVGSRNVSFVID